MSEHCQGCWSWEQKHRRQQNELDRLRADLAQMREALYEYGQHAHSCRKNTYPLLEPKECDCGLKEVLARTAEQNSEGERG